MERHEQHGSDDGFSLIEVVVAMMLLALLALVTLPLFMTGIRITAANGSETTGTAAVGSVLEQARAAVAAAASGGCDALKDFASTTVPSLAADFPDAQGRTPTLTMTLTASSNPTGPACTAGSPAPVTVEVSAAYGTAVSNATTIIYVLS